MSAQLQFLAAWEESPSKCIPFARRVEKPACGCLKWLGAHGARETPVPMPNTAVKPRSGYNTWGSPLGK